MNNTFKTDKRSLKTRDRIKKAVIVLLKNNTNKITVLQITSLAKLSRNTFYTHYCDINDVYDDIFIDIMENFDGIFKKYNYEEFVQKPYPFLKEIVTVTELNSAFSEYVLFSKSPNGMVQKLIDELTDRFYKLYLSSRGDNNPILPYLINFIIGGVLEIIHKWYKEGKNVNLDSVLESVNQIIKDSIVMVRDVKKLNAN